MRGKQANSFCEWVVGANYSSRKKVSNATHKAVVANLSWQTDDETDTDTIALSIPRLKRSTKAARAKQEKQVRFAPTGDDTSAAGEAKEVSSDTDSTINSTDSASDSEIDSDCPCGKCTSKRQTLNSTLQKDKTTKVSDTEVSNAGENTEASEGEATGEEVDSDCPCGKCFSARQRLKQQKQTGKKAEPESDAEIHAKHKEKKAKEKAAKEQADKANSKANNESSGNGKGKQGKNKNKQNQGKGKSNGQEQDEKPGDDSDKGETTEEDASKSNAKGNQKKTKGRNAEAQEQEEPEKTSKFKSRKKDKKSRTFTQPVPRRPDLLMPVNAQVLQIEHSVEGAEDPRPNAFYDAEHGVMRVYHGGAYGNPYGALYPKRWGQNMPLGVPHPSQNPWMYGYAPSHAPPPPPPALPGAQPAGPGHPWYAGAGTVQVPVPVTPKPKDDQAVYNESPSLRAAAKRDNNVVPFPPQTPKVTSGGSKKNAKVDGPWGIQGDQGSRDNAAGGDNKGGANPEGFGAWSPQHSQRLDQDLAALSKKSNGSKAGSQKNADGGWNDTNVSDWVAKTGNEDNNNNNWSIAGGQNNGGIWGTTGATGAWFDAKDSNNSNCTQIENNAKVEENAVGQNNNNDQGDDGYGPWVGDTNQAANGQKDAEASKGSPSNKPPSTGGNVGPAKAADNTSPESNHSHKSNTSMPGAWPPSSGGGNVFGSSGPPNQGQERSSKKVADNFGTTNDWGNGGIFNADAANSTGGFWETAEGQQGRQRADRVW